MRYAFLMQVPINELSSICYGLKKVKKWEQLDGFRPLYQLLFDTIIKYTEPSIKNFGWNLAKAKNYAYGLLHRDGDNFVGVSIKRYHNGYNTEDDESSSSESHSGSEYDFLSDDGFF